MLYINNINLIPLLSPNYAATFHFLGSVYPFAQEQRRVIYQISIKTSGFFDKTKKKSEIVKYMSDQHSFFQSK